MEAKSMLDYVKMNEILCLIVASLFLLFGALSDCFFSHVKIKFLFNYFFVIIILFSLFYKRNKIVVHWTSYSEHDAWRIKTSHKIILFWKYYVPWPNTSTILLYFENNIYFSIKKYI